MLSLLTGTSQINVKRTRLSELQFIPLMGFGTYDIKDSNVITNALKVGYRHFDLAHSYLNSVLVKAALTTALRPVEEGGLGIQREEIWLTMKVNTLSYNLRSPEAYMRRLLAEVGTVSPLPSSRTVISVERYVVSGMENDGRPTNCTREKSGSIQFLYSAYCSSSKYMWRIQFEETFCKRNSD